MSDSQKKKVKKVKTKKVLTTFQKKKRRRKILNGLLISCIVLGILCCSAGVTMIYSMIKGSSVVLNVEDFKSPESTLIYDRHGELIGTVGVENRINVTYDKLPQVVVDAFVSIEDSRFFEHNGFDIPRFTKAFLENIKSMSFAQGGSTLTMQMVKNTYFVTAESLAEKSIPRKVQEIYFSLKIEKLINKKKIFELYINKINFGGPARGIEAGAQYYFGKSCSDLTLSEAATLAGVINLPNVYNPYYNIDYATTRRNEVLNLMLKHGYITETECEVAKKIKVEDLLIGDKKDLDSNKSDYLQSYIDKVLDEVEEITGEDPYTTAMRIYTGMDPVVQLAADQICRGESFSFPDGNIQTGFAVVDNDTGIIVALGGGRGRNGERTFSFATDARKQPGSSIKPILDYALGFEYIGMATSHTEYDEKTTWKGTNITVTNANGRFIGDVTLQHALSGSLNIPALKVLRKVIDTAGPEKIREYLRTIGFDESAVKGFNEQYSIGGADLTVSPLQMAAAQATLFNNGLYIEPHCITRIEYIDGSQEPYTPTYTPVRALSEASAYLIANMMEKNVSNDIYLGNVKQIKKSYPVYAKTGTTDWGTAGKQYGIPTTAAKDSWMNASTSQFTIATWLGYDKAVKGQTSYITTKTFNMNIPAKINNRLLDALAKAYGKPKAIAKPKGIESISHVLATWPYKAAPEWCPKEYIVTGEVKAGTAKIEPWETPTIDEITSFTATLTSNTNNSATVQLDYSPLSDKMPTVIELKEITWPKNVWKQNVKVNRLFSKTWIDGIVKYYVEVTDENEDVLGVYALDKASDVLTLDLNSLTEGNHNLRLRGYYSYTIAPVRSGSIDQYTTVHVDKEDIPVTPEVPEVPEVPETPVVPETPIDPETPENGTNAD